MDNFVVDIDKVLDDFEGSLHHKNKNSEPCNSCDNTTNNFGISPNIDISKNEETEEAKSEILSQINDTENLGSQIENESSLSDVDPCSYYSFNPNLAAEENGLNSNIDIHTTTYSQNVDNNDQIISVPSPSSSPPPPPYSMESTEESNNKVKDSNSVLDASPTKKRVRPNTFTSDMTTFPFNHNETAELPSISADPSPSVHADNYEEIENPLHPIVKPWPEQFPIPSNTCPPPPPSHPERPSDLMVSNSSINPRLIDSFSVSSSQIIMQNTDNISVEDIGTSTSPNIITLLDESPTEASVPANVASTVHASSPLTVSEFSLPYSVDENTSASEESRINPPPPSSSSISSLFQPPVPPTSSSSSSTSSSHLASSGGGINDSSNWPPNGLNEDEIGKREPQWVSDDSSLSCMACSVKFTMFRRRHHCRACGQLLCSSCCNWWMHLEFLKAKARVCAKCYALLIRMEAASQRSSEDRMSPGSSRLKLPLTSALKRSRPPSITIHSTDVPIQGNQQQQNLVNILSFDNENNYSSTIKSVSFSDGLRPGRDLMETSERGSTAITTPTLPPTMNNATVPFDSTTTTIISTTTTAAAAVNTTTNIQNHLHHHHHLLSPFQQSQKSLEELFDVCLLPSWDNDTLMKGCSHDDEDDIIPLPPTVDMSSSETKISMVPDFNQVKQMLTISSGIRYSQEVLFAITRNIHLSVSRWKICNEMEPIGWQTRSGGGGGGSGSGPGVDSECWRFVSHGLETIGQQEIALLLMCDMNNSKGECLPPMCIFKFYYQIYMKARISPTPPGQISPICELSFYQNDLRLTRLPFACNSGLLLVSLRHINHFIQMKSISNCHTIMHNLPFGCLIGQLIHENEIVWARSLPLRLLYRLGLAAQCYPWPLITKRDRTSLYYEMGHTVLRLLIDFQSYRFTLHTIPGLCVTMGSNRITKIQIPKSSYAAIMKVVNERPDVNSVLAFGTVFNMDADSALVCVQNDDDERYTTEAIYMQDSQHRNTGVSFVAFNCGQRVTHISLVEDGLLIQMTDKDFQDFIISLRDGRDFTMNSSPSMTTTGGFGGVGGGGETTIDNHHQQQHQHDTVHVIWNDNNQPDAQLALTTISWVDGSLLYMDHGYCESRCIATGHQLCYRVPTENQLRCASNYLLNLPSGQHCKYLLSFSRIFVIHCPEDCEDRSKGEPMDPLLLCEPLANALIKSLMPFVEVLRASGIVGIALRVTLDCDQAGYLIGCRNWSGECGQALPHFCTVDGTIDDALVPILYPQANQILHGPLEMELLFPLLQV